MPRPDILQHFSSVSGLWYQNSSTQKHGGDGSKGREEIKVHELGNDAGPNPAAAFLHQGYEKNPPQTGASTTKKGYNPTRIATPLV